ncbi:hypothetical protein [Streptomyces colonosanans]|uniref:Sortase n=1 Tax=Streptomyces colonosanans TaxID=1428652 RepID=A0A1S2P3S2_9ACTN|nr:hypothetical protein [Streptomyces colonosanans]OIJ88075.1 hypothetical protein BIV24_23260 [Streptomyces colonosanans]
MGSLRLTLCAVALIAVVLGRATHTADAHDVSLTPASPAPGSSVRLTVRGCPGTTGTAVSDAFVTDARLVGKNGTLTGDTVVRAMLTPGRYDIKVGCDGREVKGVLTVDGSTASTPDTPSGPAPRPAGSSEPYAPAVPAVPRIPAFPAPSAPTARSSPVAPVHAGGGGTAHLKALASGEARNSGPGARQAIIGLVLASVAAVLIVVRSVRRGRGKE